MRTQVKCMPASVCRRWAAVGFPDREAGSVCRPSGTCGWLFQSSSSCAWSREKCYDYWIMCNAVLWLGFLYNVFRGAYVMVMYELNSSDRLRPGNLWYISLTSGRRSAR